VLTALTLVGWLLLVWIARDWGQRLVAERGFEQLRLGSPPLIGRDDFVLGWRTLVPVIVGAAGIVVLPWAARHLSWRRLLLAVLVSTAVWAVAVNFTRGEEGITGPMVRVGDEYLLDVEKIDSPGDFLENFTADIDDYVVHVRSHPPGFIMLLWLLDAVGLAGVRWATALVVLGGASASAAVLVGVRNLTGEDAARRVAPFLELAPAALWIASTADALFAGVAAWAVAALALATARRDARGDLLAVAAGLLFGVSLMFSYGLVLLAVVVLPLLIVRRRVRPAIIAAGGALIVPLSFGLAGFDYVEGFEVTRREVDESVQSTRPFTYFAIANVAAFALVIGPATVVGLTRLRDRSTWVLVGGALAAVALADLSGLSKGEVERIWLVFAVWTIAACSALVPTLRGRSLEVRAWLGVQLLVALVVQTYVRTGW
jgi:hypothetical protein